MAYHYKHLQEGTASYLSHPMFALLVVSFVVKCYIILKLADLFKAIEVDAFFSSWGHLHGGNIQLQNPHQVLKEELKVLLVRVLQMALLLFYIISVVLILLWSL